MSYKLGFNTHGKGRVRVVKVTRRPDGVHEVSQMNVQILLEGDNMDDVYLAGNNKKVVATDTCKNTVYCLAKENEFNSIEDFGLIICKHFLAEYPQIVNKINVQIIADKWERLNLPDSAGKTAPHKHAFRRIGPMRPFTHVTGVKRASQGSSFQVQSGFRNLDILKTTQSGFIDFHRNKFTSLPEDTDRLLGTSVDAQWSYNAWMLSRSSPNFNEISDLILRTLVTTFAGPSDVGVYSASVQATLYNMGVDVLKAVPQVDNITLEMPNIHNIAFPLDKYGLTNKDYTGSPTIFFPIDEPHGMIKAVVERTKSRL